MRRLPPLLRRLPVQHLLSVLSVLLLTSATALATTPPQSTTVTMLNWEEFLSPKFIKTLKNKYRINLKLLTYASSEERDAILGKQRASIDIVVTEPAVLGEYRNRGWLEKLDLKKLPNVKHVMLKLRASSDYGVPYLWGHTGIAWRTDKVTSPITNYAQLFALAKSNPGKVSVTDDPNDALRAALYAFSKPPYKLETVADVVAADRLLQPRLRDLRIVGSEMGEDSPWVNGSLIAGQAYNGDIAYLRDTYNAPLAFAIPSPGCMVFQEQMMMLASAPNKAGAYTVLNLINDPRLAARNAMDVRYASANTLAGQYLDAAFRTDPIIRPTLDGLSGCYFYDSTNAETTKAVMAVRLTPGK